MYFFFHLCTLSLSSFNIYNLFVAIYHVYLFFFHLSFIVFLSFLSYHLAFIHLLLFTTNDFYLHSFSFIVYHLSLVYYHLTFFSLIFFIFFINHLTFITSSPALWTTVLGYRTRGLGKRPSVAVLVESCLSLTLSIFSVHIRVLLLVCFIYTHPLLVSTIFQYSTLNIVFFSL